MKREKQSFGKSGVVKRETQSFGTSGVVKRETQPRGKSGVVDFSLYGPVLVSEGWPDRARHFGFPVFHSSVTGNSTS